MKGSIGAACVHDEGRAALDDAGHRAGVPSVVDRGGVKRGQKELVVGSLRLQLSLTPVWHIMATASVPSIPSQ